MQLKLGRIKVRGVIEAAVAGLRERLKQSGIELEIKIEPGIDEFVADGARVTQILYNLLANAIGFSPPGGRVMLSCRRDQAMLAFTVEDQGCGIPEEYQSAVFERFESRANGSGHRGAGLGLTIVRSLVELHGGSDHARLHARPRHAGAGAFAARKRDGRRGVGTRAAPRGMSFSWRLDELDLVGLDRLAQRLALILKPGDVIALSGPLGAGKTTFARLLLTRLGGEGEVPSPSFALVQAYETPRFIVQHCDFYRLQPGDLGELGLEDALASSVTHRRMAGARGRLAARKTGSTSPWTRRPTLIAAASS